MMRALKPSETRVLQAQKKEQRGAWRASLLDVSTGV